MVGLRLGLSLLGTDILPDDAGGRGHTRFAPPGPWFTERVRPLTEAQADVVRRFLVTYLAGYAAEARLGTPSREGSGFDERDVVREWLGLMSDSDSGRAALRASSEEKAQAMLSDNAPWDEVGAVAALLLAERRLDAAQVRAVMRPG